MGGRHQVGDRVGCGATVRIGPNGQVDDREFDHRPEPRFSAAVTAGQEVEPRAKAKRASIAAA